MKDALKQYKEREPGITCILVGTRRDDPHGGKYCEHTQISGLYVVM
jgi:hypothetical protein